MRRTRYDQQRRLYLCSPLQGKARSELVPSAKRDDPAYDQWIYWLKLAVHPHAQGKGIGEILCHAAIDKAKDMKAKVPFS